MVTRNFLQEDLVPASIAAHALSQFPFDDETICGLGLKTLSLCAILISVNHNGYGVDTAWTHMASVACMSERCSLSHELLA